MTFYAIQKQRVDALLARWVREPWLPVSAGDLSRIGIIEATYDPDDVEISRVGRRSAKRVAIVKRQGVDGPDAYSVWTTADYRSYRKAYAAFIRLVYGVDPEPGFARFEVDHLFNKARTDTTGDFLRLEAIDPAVNGAWGRVFEKMGSRAGSFRRRAVSERNMDFLIAAKLAGAMPPDGAGDVPGIRRIAAALRAHGLMNEGGMTVERQLWEALARAEMTRGEGALPAPPPGL